MIIGKFTRYQPTDERLLSDAEVIRNNTGIEVIFLRTKDGKDWYDVQSVFKPDSIKIVYNDSGIILSYSQDASSLNPVDSFVAEVSADDFPNGVDILGGWRFDGEKITPLDVDHVAENESEKQILLANATAIIAPLQDAVELSMATDQEIENLREWKKYRVLLNRVDPKDPHWPPKPTLATRQ